MKKVAFVLASIAALAVFTVSAQTQSTSAGSCSDVKWKADVLKKYPDINKACVDVVVRDGVRYVKVSGKVRRAANGTLTVRLDHSEGDITWKPGAGDTVLIEGEPLAVADVKVGQSLHFYMPEDRVAVANINDKGVTSREVVP